MTHILILLLALLIGVVAGLRSLTAPAVVAWAAALDWIDLDHTWASWVDNKITLVVLTILAIGELVSDKLPKTPPRTAPPGVRSPARDGRVRRRGARRLAALGRLPRWAPA